MALLNQREHFSRVATGVDPQSMDCEPLKNQHLRVQPVIDQSCRVCWYVLDHPIEDIPSHIDQHDPVILMNVLFVWFDG